MASVVYRKAFVFLASPLILLGFGCTPASVMERIEPPEVKQYVRAFLDSLLAAPAERAITAFSLRLAQEHGAIDSLRRVQRQIAAIGTIDSVNLVSGRVSTVGTGPAQRDLAYEAYGSRGIALVEVHLVDESKRLVVDAVSIEPLDAPLAVTHRFLANLGPAQVVVLCLVIGGAVFTLGTAILVAFTRMPRRWLWAFVALISTGHYAINWTTGAASTQLLSVHLFGASIARIGLVGPWVIGFSFPIGAIVALRRRRRALATAAQSVVITGSASSTGSSGI